MAAEVRWRAEIEVLVESVFHEHTQRSGHLVSLLATYVADALAQAGREREEEIAGLQAEIARLHDELASEWGG